MRKLLVGAALAGLMAAPVGAQEPVTSGHGSFYVGPYVGYMLWGEFWDFGTGEQTMDDGVAFGAQAGWSFTPNISLLGNFLWSEAGWAFDPDGSGPDQQYQADLGIWLYDANLQFRLPFGQSSGWIAPFAQVGAGAIKWTAETDDFNSESETNFAFNVGVGGDFQFMERVGLRIMAKDYITSTAWKDVGEVDLDDNVDGNVAHNWLISLGLNFGF